MMHWHCCCSRLCYTSAEAVTDRPPCMLLLQPGSNTTDPSLTHPVLLSLCLFAVVHSLLFHCLPHTVAH